MKFMFSVIFCALLVNNTFPQIHKIEKEYYDKIRTTIINRRDVEISPLKKTNVELNKSVFGFLPYWELSNVQFIIYDLLTHIALFDFYVDSLGNIEYPSGWDTNYDTWKQVIIEAQSQNVKVMMTAVNFESLHIKSILTNEQAKNNFLNTAVEIINENNFDGIIVDFENLAVEDRGETLSNFIMELNTTVKANTGENNLTAFASPAINWGGWEFQDLADNCDFLFLMAYDYFGSWSTTSGPTAPLKGSDPNSFKNLNVVSSLEVEYQSVIGNNPGKIILGLPYYGIHFYTNDPLPNSEVLGTTEITPRFRDSKLIYSQYDKVWSSVFDVPYSSWQDTVWNQYWMDDDSSLGLKFDLVNDYDLMGVGMWALGYDGARTELWNLIENKFSSTAVAVEQIDELPGEFILHQNYPNPFNPSTIIKYTILTPHQGEGVREGFFVTLKIYDVLGNEIKTVVNENKSPGVYEIIFNAENLSSGIYFYRLIAGNYSSTKKMILLR
ncbi:MAG: glycosyl hydrolase family 18 protein [Ignavibacteria bacterium]|jgi:spore germination protein YaaH